MKYWIIVASKDHVEIAKKGKFCQVSHGSLRPLEKISPGDGILFYSSKETLDSAKSYQKFTGVGKVREGQPYQVKMDTGFKAFRRDICFKECREVNIRPLLDELHFVENPKQWGYKLMKGFLDIDQHDFKLISSKMLQ